MLEKSFAAPLGWIQDKDPLLGFLIRVWVLPCFRFWISGVVLCVSSFGLTFSFIFLKVNKNVVN